MKKILFVGIMLITAMFLLSGCYANIYGGSKTYTCDDGTEVLEKAQCAELELLKQQAEDLKEYANNLETEAKEIVEEDEPKTETEPEEVDSSDEAVELISKFSKVKSVVRSCISNDSFPFKIPPFRSISSREKGISLRLSVIWMIRTSATFVSGS